MKKFISGVLFALLFILLIYPSNISTNASLSAENKEIYEDYGNQGYIVEQSRQKMDINFLDTISEKLNNKIPVTIYSDNIDIKKLIPLFEKFKLPIILSYEDALLLDKIENSGKEIDTPDGYEKKDSLQSINSKTEVIPMLNLLPGEQNVRVAITVLRHKKNKTNEEMLKLSRQFISNMNFRRNLEELEDSIAHTNSKNYEMRANGNLLDTIRKTVYEYDDFYYAGFTTENLMCSKSVIDYIITNWQDSNPNYDHITYEASAQLYTFEAINQGQPPYCTKKYTTKIDNFYAGDKLIDSDPSNTITLNSNSNIGISIGYPASISISFPWTGNNSVRLEALGNKTTQLYYNQFTRAMGISDDVVDHKFVTMYKLNNNGPYKVNINTYFGVGVKNISMDYTTYNSGWDTLVLYN